MARLTSAPTTITIVTSTPDWGPTVGQFATVSLANPSSVDPDPTNTAVYRGDGTGFAAIWNVWCGGAFAPTLGAYGSLLCFGGGNRAYDGNEVVAYDVAARRWSLLSQPAPYGSVTSGDSNSVNVNVDTNGSWPNGTPFPNHTYFGIEFLPAEAGGGTLGSFVFMGHPQNSVHITSNNLWRFDLALRTWTRWLMPYNFGEYQSNGLAYDSKRKGLWLVAPNRDVSYYSLCLWFIDVKAQTVTKVGLNSVGGNMGPEFYYSAPCYVASRDCIVLPKGAGSPSLDIVAIDLSGLVVSAGQMVPTITIQQSGTKCPSLWCYPSGGAPDDEKYLNYASGDRLEYCSHDGNLYALNMYAGSSCELYRLSPPAGALTGTWTWTHETLSPKSGESLALKASTVGTVTDKQLMGRMRYVPLLKSFVISDDSTLPAQLLRPAAFL